MTKFSPRGDGNGLESRGVWQGRRAKKLLVAEEDSDWCVNRLDELCGHELGESNDVIVQFCVV